MLNGIAPVIIFHLYSDSVMNAVSGLSSKVSNKIAIKPATFQKIGGVPIPIYLSEKLFKTAWKGHDLSVNIGTKTVGDQVFQQPYNSNITIELSFNRDRSILAKLLPLLDLCYKKIASDTYNISYFNRDIVALKAKLSDIKQSSNADGTLSSLSITLSREIKDDKDKKEDIPCKEKTTTATNEVPIGEWR
jgi:hypothetical protein